MNAFNDLILWLDQFLGSANYFPFLLLGTGLFFTIYLGFPQIRYFKHAMKVVVGKFDKADDKGDTSHFGALTTALSGTVGTGNIGGVGLALFLGGPAALFWMWATAFLGMTTKFVEVTLSHKYREVDDKGEISGGPMYYMENKLNMKWLAILFSVAVVFSSFGSGNMPQINSIAAGMNHTFGIEPMLTGGVLSILLLLVIVGGIKRIATFTEAVVPTMALIYIIGALGVIFYNIENILPSFTMIFSDIMNGSAATGGFLGASFAYALDRGVNRGLYSNEAGQGSAAIAHAAAKTDEPVSEGMVSILEPFIDTLIICTLTGLVILSSGAWTKKFDNQFQRADLQIIEGVYTDTNKEDIAKLFAHLNPKNSDNITKFTGKIEVFNGEARAGNYTIINARSVAEDIRYELDGKPYTGEISVSDGRLSRDTLVVVSGKSLLHSVRLTTQAFTSSYFGDYGKYIVSIGLLLFAFSTAIAWSYYGDRAITYLVGSKGVLPYRIVYVAAFFFASFADTTVIWNIALVTVVLMTIPNLVGILLLHKDMKKSISDYWERFAKEHPGE
ncbi:MAG: sodium:alanine symporter family protein [Gammaproteobacteria bacterium]|nr:MAG: sodium:alanine symporter family protein [Gammaproteobacteria bacterium]